MGIAPGENRRQFVATVVITFMFVMAGWFLYALHFDLTVRVGNCQKKMVECVLNKNNCLREREVTLTEVQSAKMQIGNQNRQIQSLKEQIAAKDRADKQAALDQAQKDSDEAKNCLTETQKKLEELNKKVAELKKDLEIWQAEAEKLKIENKTVTLVIEEAA